MKRQRSISRRVAQLRPSATVEMTEKVRAARASGRRIFSLASGDPGIPTDPRIIEAAYDAFKAGDTRYAPVLGEPRLRAALAAHEQRRSGVLFKEDDIIVTPGGKFALLTALMGVVETGDEVLVPEPGWVSYGPCVELCGGKPVLLPMLDRLDLAAMEAAVTPATVAMIINSPVNPTGRVISREEIDGLVELADRHNLWIIFDQVYSDLVHGPSFPSPQGTGKGRAFTFVVDSFSKTFGMTGWRLGHLAVPPGLTKPISRFMQHSVYCVPGAVQAAGLKALELYDEVVPGYRAMFRRRQGDAAARLDAVAGIRCTAPDASFYLFPAVDTDDRALAARWLDQLDVATVPGSAFGSAGAGHLRLSVTASDEEIDEALRRIAAAGLA
ncbi:pyridoxal phosphate-dependent aminotransferase [Rhodoligotrophos defluvii]|uniref:pyridoxal phosphate-dependent aminotransferase n=1 Tax=Rhodoligotrophos defluvii TaxID=2561934 RepID=UPI001484FBFB|nr:aminotransferase class I/II-fold pyridoxal phosphate-dependent enzyme [Rhodoligotrophos defluvii]